MVTPSDPDAKHSGPSPALPELPELSASSLARAVVETVRSPLVVLDDAMTVVEVNPAFLATFGLQRTGTVGEPFFALAATQPDRDQLRDTLEHALHDGEEIRDLELRLRLKGRGFRTLVLSARRVVLRGAEQNLLLISMEDITVQEAVEQRMRDYAVRLERSNRDLQDFAHAAAHDLQEPLRKVRAYAHGLRDRLGAAVLDTRSMEDLGRMAAAVARMQDRIDDMLELARVGRAEPALEKVSLDDVLRRVLEDLEVTIRESHARIDVDPLPDVVADPSQMAILFQNLVENAIKFAAEGEPPRVRIRSPGGSAGEREGGPPAAVRVAVEDAGVGFEQQYAERIFSPFERLYAQTRYSGSGVGLALCRRIAEHHGGTITAESAPGQGSRFTVVLPAASR